MFSSSPPAGISCSALDDERLDSLSAQIVGASSTPYEGGVFQLEIQIPDRYPFEPPRIRFVTPIYHPNIDKSGRICMDTLKVPPKGTWRPCLNIATVLMMIRVLMGEPGSEDPLMTDIWQEFKYDYVTYAEKAKQWTQRHALAQSLNHKGQLSEMTENHIHEDPTSSECCSNIKDLSSKSKISTNFDQNNAKKMKENQESQPTDGSCLKKRKLRLHKTDF
ncbi:Ubiquitin-conjugating enzyme E2 T [Bulinus truncatus]|nr:Ubiquitin-conjugating enzyme E2 T [Bulinus truncatus]